MRKFLRRLRDALETPLDMSSGPGHLDPEQHRTIYALFVVLTADEAFPADAVQSWVDGRTGRHPGVLREYQDAVRLLDDIAARAHGDGKFHDLDVGARDRLLRALLRRFPHAMATRSRWRRQVRPYVDFLRTLATPHRIRRFRTHVVSDLLAFYYTTESGWGAVSYRAFPGRSPAELEPCEVAGFRVEGDAMILEMTDGSCEKLEPLRLEADEERGIAVRVKGGRQRVTFSRNAWHEFGKHLDAVEDSFVLRIGSSTWEVLL